MKKKQAKKASKEKTTLKTKEKENRFFEAVGRRKTSTARVRIYSKGSGEILINQKPLAEYFPMPEAQEKVLAPLKITDCLGKFQASVKVRGGGLNSQAEAVRHGLARALVDFDQDLRKSLKKTGFLTRDPRMRERKKFGLRRARRARQWRKR